MLVLSPRLLAQQPVPASNLCSAYGLPATSPRLCDQAEQARDTWKDLCPQCYALTKAKAAFVACLPIAVVAP